MVSTENIHKPAKKPGTRDEAGLNLHRIMLIVDDNSLGMLEKINYHREWGYQVLYILTDSPSIKAQFNNRSGIYSINANIRSLLRYNIVDEIVCCISNLPDGYLSNLLDISLQFGIALLAVPVVDKTGLLPASCTYIGNLPFNTFEAGSRNRIAYTVKTAVEMITAGMALLILSPFLIFMAFLITSTSHGPAIFKQQRLGFRGRMFYVYKFRTMVIDAEKLKAALMEFNEGDGPSFKIRNDPRLTSVGRFLKKTGLDEIPQLVNVMRGEMSLIGPRPLIPDKVPGQTGLKLKRMSVKPGIKCY